MHSPSARRRLSWHLSLLCASLRTGLVFRLFWRSALQHPCEPARYNGAGDRVLVSSKTLEIEMGSAWGRVILSGCNPDSSGRQVQLGYLGNHRCYCGSHSHVWVVGVETKRWELASFSCIYARAGLDDDLLDCGVAGDGRSTCASDTSASNYLVRRRPLGAARAVDLEYCQTTKGLQSQWPGDAGGCNGYPVSPGHSDRGLHP